MTILLGYSLVCIAIVAVVELGRRQTKERFLVADRKVGGFFGALAVAGSWIWAPALFVSTQVGYTWGYSGLIWFVVPNMLALILFAPVACRVRRHLPEGYSYIQFIRYKNGRFREVQLCIQMLVQVVCCGIQLTAGAELLTFVSGTPYTTIVLVMALAPLCYCLLAGLVSSILTDCIQYLVIIGSICVIFLNLPLSQNLPALLQARFAPFDSTVLLQFGIGSFLTLIFGIFSNHQQWQRSFAAEVRHVGQTFSVAGCLHGVVTFSLGTLGVLLAQSGYITHHVQIVGAEYIAANMAPIFSSTFMVMALSGLCATMSSAFCAFGSLYATEMALDRDPIRASRQAMTVLSVLAFLVAIFRAPVIVLWMFCGLIRLSTAAPTILSVFCKQLSGRAAVLAIVTSMAAGAPFFVYGSILDNSIWRTCAMALSLAISVGICLIQILWAPEEPIDQSANPSTVLNPIVETCLREH